MLSQQPPADHHRARCVADAIVPEARPCRRVVLLSLVSDNVCALAIAGKVVETCQGIR